ncbi:MAG: cytochrome b [Magnetococcales bacterium]|nr:cytochrome b [Magnetococcales bacterium]NGZ28184.1 cytochrome b [Magnetococcales bacterium]
MWKNTDEGYGRIARLLHWTMAVLLLGLCGLGFYITTLTYYHPWYRIAPDWHRSLGMLAFLLVFVRLAWRFYSPPPPLQAGLAPLEKLAAHGVHLALYGLMFAMPVAGYLLSTADGRGVDIFGWFTIPAYFPPSKGMETVAGKIHLILGILLVALALLHALAALKHHFINRDNTLKRMLTGPTSH